MAINKDVKDKCFFSNDATSKILGLDYQKLIALEVCLNAKLNENIWIECKGDVSDATTSIEVKHHLNSHNLTSNSSDAWKTLKNYIVEFQVTKTFDHLVLLTTSSIPSNSIFFDWNNKKISERLKLIESHSPADSVKEFHGLLVDSEKENLKLVLDRFSILSDQTTAEGKWNELRDHPAFLTIPDEHKDNAIQCLYGLLTKIAIDNPKEWKVNINDFKHDSMLALAQFTSGKMPFYHVSKSDILVDSENNDFNFIEKMKDIKMKRRNIEDAVSDYFRAQISQERMLKKSPALFENLDQYDSSVRSDMDGEKLKFSYCLNDIDVGTEVADGKSRELYLHYISKPHLLIRGVDHTEKYYRDGRVHHVVEEYDFEWKFNSEDI